MKYILRIISTIFLFAFIASCSEKQRETIDYGESISDIPDLNGKKISTLAGSVQELMIDTYCPDAEVLRLNSSAEVIAAVVSGQADYFLIDTTSLIGAGIEEKGLKVIFKTGLISSEIGFGFNYKDQALCDEFNAFLARYKDDGRWSQTYKRWMQGDPNTVELEHPELNPNGPTLRIGTNNYFPYSFTKNGRYTGFEMEMIEAFAYETGRNVEYLTIDFSGVIAALAAGKIDMISSSMTITEERAKKVLFTDPYFYGSTVGVCRSGDAPVNQKSFFTKVKESFYNNLIVEDRWKIVVDGLWETIIISLCSILLGTLFGGFICWMRLSRRKLLGSIAKVYIEIIRGVPILVLLMLMFYVIFAQTAVSPRWVAIIAFAMNFGAYVSEMFRTGILSVDKGQTEAGLAMGFTPFKTFVNFVVPQAAKHALPVFKGEAVSLFKNTSVVGFIAIQDLTKASEIIRARTFDAFFPLIIVSIIYFLLAWLLGKVLDGLAKKIK